MLLFTELAKMKIQVWKQCFVLQILLIRSVSPDKNRKIRCRNEYLSHLSMKGTAGLEGLQQI